MKTPEKLAALRRARQTIKARNKQIARMKAQLMERITEDGIEVSDDVENDMQEAIKSYNDEIVALPQNDFRRLFWEQQVWIYYDVQLYY